MASERVVELDDKIIVGGEETTIRTEIENGTSFALGENKGEHLGQQPIGHWVVIDGEAFLISSENYAFLRGEASNVSIPQPTPTTLSDRGLIDAEAEAETETETNPRAEALLQEIEKRGLCL